MRKHHYRHVKRRVRHHKQKPLIHKSFLILAIITALVITAVGVVRSQYFEKRVRGEGNRPNFIVIMTDDQRADTLQYMQSVQDDLVAKGVTFKNSYVTTSLCCPSRTSFLTGKYAYHHGVYTNRSDQHGGYDSFMKHDNADHTIALWLHNAGYKTSMVGKYLNGYGERKKAPPGWDDWHVFADAEYYNYTLNECADCSAGNKININRYGRAPEKYSTDLLKEKALAFLRTTPEPFFLVFTPKAPHGGGGQEEGLNNPEVAPRHEGTCIDLPSNTSPAFNEQDVSDKPKWIREKNKFDGRKKQDIALFAKKQVCSLKAVDEAVEAIINELKSSGRIDNTVIIFTSDNGYAWGEHRLTHKNCLYEECSRVPLVISYPPLTPTGSETQEFALNIDLAATILALTGVPLPENEKVDGKSLVPLLTDINAGVRDNFLLEVYSTGRTSPTSSALRTKQYKIIEYNNGAREFYDEVNDRYEEINAIDDPNYASIIQQLSPQLQTFKGN